MELQARIIDKRRGLNNFIELKFNGYEIQANIFDEGSHYGIEEGCISKLWIRKDFKVVYNWDRGEDINIIDINDLEMIVDAIGQIDQSGLTKQYQTITII